MSTSGTVAKIKKIVGEKCSKGDVGCLQSVAEGYNHGMWFCDGKREAGDVGGFVLFLCVTW